MLANTPIAIAAWSRFELRTEVRPRWILLCKELPITFSQGTKKVSMIDYRKGKPRVGVMAGTIVKKYIFIEISVAF